MRIISIDPGISGGVALLEFNANNGDGLPRIVVREVHSMPTMPRKKDGTGEAVNYAVLADVLEMSRPEIVVLEKVTGMANRRGAKACPACKRPFGPGSSGLVNFGISFGVLIGCAARYPQVYVGPAQWKKRLGIPSSSENKDFARTFALQTFPYLGEQLKCKKDVGRAEAVLIGYDYLRQLADEPAIEPSLTLGRIPVPAGYTRELDL